MQKINQKTLRTLLYISKKVDLFSYIAKRIEKIAILMVYDILENQKNVNVSYYAKGGK